MKYLFLECSNDSDRSVYAVVKVTAALTKLIKTAQKIVKSGPARRLGMMEFTAMEESPIFFDNRYVDGNVSGVSEISARVYNKIVAHVGSEHLQVEPPRIHVGETTFHWRADWGDDGFVETNYFPINSL